MNPTPCITQIKVEMCKWEDVPADRFWVSDEHGQNDIQIRLEDTGEVCLCITKSAEIDPRDQLKAVTVPYELFVKHFQELFERISNERTN